MKADLITVYHNATNFEQHHQLFKSIRHFEHEGGYRLIGVDNRTQNRGFAAGCNLGALHPGADAPIIGFLNPDVVVNGRFLDRVTQTLTGDVVITGCRFGKSQDEIETWGMQDWVCGAAMFISRNFFLGAGGFDEQFVWGWEETDLIRQAQARNLICKSIQLPLTHESPTVNSEQDIRYKNTHFTQGGRRFYQKWPSDTRRPVVPWSPR